MSEDDTTPPPVNPKLEKLRLDLVAGLQIFGRVDLSVDLESATHEEDTGLQIGGTSLTVYPSAGEWIVSRYEIVDGEDDVKIVDLLKINPDDLELVTKIIGEVAKDLHRLHKEIQVQVAESSDEQLEEIARGNIEQYLADAVDGEAPTPDSIYDQAYTLGFDALVDDGVPQEKAREIAQRVAQKFAQP